MRSVTCDNCTNSYPFDRHGASKGWIKVGWSPDTLHDACSPECAHAIVDTMVADVVEP